MDTKFLIMATGLLLCGSMNTVLSNGIAFKMDSTKINGETKPFEKPWYFNLMMFLGMAGAYFFMLRENKQKAENDLRAPLISNDTSSEAASDDTEGSATKLQVTRDHTPVHFFIIPAVFDLFGTGISSLGQVLLPGSVWQIISGSILLFTALLSVFFLKRKLRLSHWLSLLLAFFGLTLVAIAAVKGHVKGESAQKSAEHSSGEIILGLTLTVIGQVIYALQFVTEELFMQSMNATPLQVVSYEGIYGFIMQIAIMSPVLYFIPGKDSNNSQENLYDTFYMISKNWYILIPTLCFAMTCLIYNVSGQNVTANLSAGHRSLLESLRALFVWAIGLSIRYIPHLFNKTTKFGEGLTNMWWLELLGFVCLTVASIKYNTTKVEVGENNETAV